MEERGGVLVWESWKQSRRQGRVQSRKFVWSGLCSGELWERLLLGVRGECRALLYRSFGIETAPPGGSKEAHETPEINFTSPFLTVIGAVITAEERGFLQTVMQGTPVAQLFGVVVYMLHSGGSFSVMVMQLPFSSPSSCKEPHRTHWFASLNLSGMVPLACCQWFI